MPLKTLSTVAFLRIRFFSFLPFSHYPEPPERGCWAIVSTPLTFPGSVPSRPPPSLSYFSSPKHILFLLSPWHSSRQMIRVGMRTWMCWKLAAHETRTANNHRTLLWDFNRSSRRICRSHFVKSRRGRRRMRLRAKERERKSNCWIKRCWWQENGCYSPVGTFRIDGHDASNSPGRR